MCYRVKPVGSPGLPFLLLLSLVLSGCDGEGATPSLPVGAACQLRSADAPQAEVWVLPARTEAKRLEDASKLRQQGTVNLMLAKYDKLRVASGSACRLLASEEGFVQIEVEGSKLTGWVPASHVTRPGQ